MHRDTESEQNKDVYKVFWKPGDENRICSQSGGLHRLTGKVTRLGKGRLGVSSELVWGGDADGPKWQTVA